jgi:7TM-HD extracellular
MERTPNFWSNQTRAHREGIPTASGKIVVFGLVLLAGFHLQANPQALPSPQQGDPAPADVIAPVPMAVVDPVRTQALRKKESRLVPAVYRFHPEAAEEAERRLREDYAATRARFREALVQAAQRHRLDSVTVRHPSFYRFVQWFQARQPGFPLTTNLARHWALPEDDSEPVLEGWARQLRNAMNQCIRGDYTPPSMADGPDQVRLVPVNAPDEVLSMKTVAQRGLEMSVTNLLTLAQVKAGFTADADGADLAWGRFLAGYLRENCFPEEELTRHARRQRAADVLAVDHYEAGDVIVRKGQTIDSRVQAALEVLRANWETGHDSQALNQAPSGGAWLGLKTRWHRIFSNPLSLETIARYALSGLAGLSLLVMLGLARLVHQKRTPRTGRSKRARQDRPGFSRLDPPLRRLRFLPWPEQADTVLDLAGPERTAPGNPAAGSTVDQEKFRYQRALEAEWRAQEILGMVRAGLAPQLARQMMTKLVRELISQRSQWMQTQQWAETDLARIEERFAQSHTRLQERLREFEKRTEELERALVVKAQETSELLKSQIALTQKQLETEKQAQELTWN